MGMLNGRSIHTVPNNAIYDGSNIIVRKGVLRERPGMTQSASTILTGSPLGFFTTPTMATGAFQEDAFQNDAFQVTASIPPTVLIVATTRKIYVFYGGILNDSSGVNTLQASLGQHSRFTSILIGTPLILNVFHVNGIDPLMGYNTDTGVFEVVVGTPTPPIMSDIATIGDSLIGLVPPYQVRWSNIREPTQWPELNVKSLSETRDAVIGISPIGYNGGTLYKEYSIWNIVITGNSGSGYFRFDWKIDIDGPASSAAIVRGSTADYYMTHGGRVVRWDGSSIMFPADGVWSYVRDTIDRTYSNRIHGAYDPSNDEYWFWYPVLGDSGAVRGCVCVIPPRPQEGIVEHIAFRGYMGHSITAATDTRLDTEKIILGRDAVGVPQIASFEGPDDLGTAITGFWQHGLEGLPVGPNAARLEQAESYFQRGASHGNVDLKIVTSNLLDNDVGTVSAAQTISLASSTKVFDIKGVDSRGRFVGPRYEFTTPITLRYKGVELRFLDRG